MDKLFRKRTARKAEKQRRKPAPLPKVPPSLDVDIRNSLILPGLSERFSLLLPSLSSVTEDSVRDLLAQQRARGQGPALTEEEEELVLAELRDRQQHQQQEQEQDPLEHEKSASRNDLPYASIVNRNNSTASVSTGFTGYTDWDGNPPSFDSHDWHSTHTARGRSGVVNSISGTSLRTDSTHMSPSESAQGIASSGSHNSLRQFHKERVQARSYGFTGSASFRDNNYLRQVQKAKANVDTIEETDSHLYGSTRSSSVNGHALPSGSEQNGHASPNPSSTGSMPNAGSLPEQFHSANGSPSTQNGEASFYTHDFTSALGPKSVHADRSYEHSSKSPSSSADQVLPETRSVPQSDDEGVPREPVTAVRTTQRQSVLANMDPQQAKRVSLALLEIETHLGRQLSRDDPREVNLNDDECEEILDGDDESDRVHSPVRGIQQPPVTEQPLNIQTQPLSQQPVKLDRQNSPASTTSSVFPFTASPASSAHVSRVGTSETHTSILTNDNGGDATPTIGSLPSSPRTLDFQRHLSSHSSHASHGSQSHHTSSSHSPHYTHNPMPSTSSVGTEIDGAEPFPQPVLKPHRPQPVRATPTPVLGSSSGYVPGQPRPVGRANGGNSISSIGSATTGPPHVLSPIGSPGSVGRRSQDGPSRPQYNVPASSQQLSRAVSSQSEKSKQARARTSSIPGTRSYVPPPGVLSSRQQNGNHVPNHSIHSLTESIGAGTVSPLLGRQKLEEPHGLDYIETEYLEDPSASEAERTPEPNVRSPPFASAPLPAAQTLSPHYIPNDDELTPPPSLAELAAPSSRRSYGRTASMNSFSSNFNSPDLDSNSPWDAIVNADKSPLDSMQYWAQSEQDRNQLDLLKSVSGMGKEELSMIQANLVQKAKDEGADEESPIAEPPTTGTLWSPYGGPSMNDLSEPIPIPPSLMSVTDLPKGPPPPRPPPPSESPSITIPTSPQSTFLHGRNPSSQVHSPIDLGGSMRGSPTVLGRNLSPQVQSPIENGGSTRGFPSAAHGRNPSSQVHSEFGSSVNGHERVMSNSQTEKSLDPNDATLNHARTISGNRKWLDDDPNKRRDIEERIRGATSDLFRAPSRSAHKRNLSKKQRGAIGAPTLVSTSHNVPCTPLLSTINKENEGPKHKGTDKKNSRWRKLSSFRKPSASDIPPQTPNPPTNLRPAKGCSPPPPASSVVQLKSKHEIKKEQLRAKAEDAVAPDLTEFKFPRAPSTTPNGQSTTDLASPEKTVAQVAPVPAPTHDRTASASTQRTHRTRASQASRSTSAPRVRSQASSISQPTPPATRAPSAAQRFPVSANDFGPVDHNEDDTMRPYSRQRGHSRQASDASVAISTFMEAGRSLGIDENRLSHMLQQTGVYDRPGTGMSMRSRTHSRSNTPSFPIASPPLSPVVGKFGSAANGPWRIPSPVAEDKQERERQRSNSSNRPQVVRRTIVMAEDAEESLYRPSFGSSSLYRPSMDSHFRPSMDGLVRPSLDGYGRPSTPPLQLQRAETNHTDDSGRSSTKGMVRGNSIRRKPVQWNSHDEELMAQSPQSHHRNLSNASEAGEELHFPPPIRFGSPGGTRSARSSMAPSTNGSIYDYYQGSLSGRERDSMTQDSSAGAQRSSQAVEITEYSDGRVIWNVVNALRHDEEGNRESMASDTHSVGSNGSDYNPGGGERDEDLPWRIGPTERLDFIRRPETRVFYTNSADVSDLIDQLSSDLAGASHGRIDIRPSSPREGAWDMPPEPSPAGLPLAYANPSTPLKGSSLRYPVPDSTRASSLTTTTDEEGNDRTVEDRLQALMDRLRLAPGGVGRAPNRTAA